MDFGDADATYVLFLPGIFPDDCMDRETISCRGVDSEQIDDISDSESENGSNCSNHDIGGIEEIKLSDLYSAVLATGTSNDIINETLPKYFTTIDAWPESCKLLCWNCSNRPEEFPWTIFLGKTKLLQPIHDENKNLFNYTDDQAPMDDKLIISNQDYAEVKAYEAHGVFCHPCCARRYIGRTNDPKITNRWEAIRFLINFCNDMYGIALDDIPESEDPMMQTKYCGTSGISSAEFMSINKRLISLEHAAQKR